MAEDGDVEGGSRRASVNRGFERAWRAVDQEGERSAHRRFAPAASDVVWDRAMHRVKASAIESGKQKCAVAIAEIKLLPRRGAQSSQHSVDNAPGAIAAACKPECLEAVIVGKF